MAGTKSKGRKGKLGKNKSRIAVYYNSGRWEWNKAQRIIKHLRRYCAANNSDGVAVNALKTLKASMPLGLSRKLEAA